MSLHKRTQKQDKYEELSLSQNKWQTLSSETNMSKIHNLFGLICKGIYDSGNWWNQKKIFLQLFETYNWGWLGKVKEYYT